MCVASALDFSRLAVSKPVAPVVVEAPATKASPPPAPSAGVAAGRPGRPPLHVDVDDQLLGKTKLCKFFSRGHCSRGRSCTFAHGEKELKDVPNLFKTELCFQFLNTGRCNRGEACRYAHTRRELRNGQARAAAHHNNHSNNNNNNSSSSSSNGKRVQQQQQSLSEANRAPSQHFANALKSQQPPSSGATGRAAALVGTEAQTWRHIIPESAAEAVPMQTWVRHSDGTCSPADGQISRQSTMFGEYADSESTVSEHQEEIPLLSPCGNFTVSSRGNRSHVSSGSTRTNMHSEAEEEEHYSEMSEEEPTYEVDMFVKNTFITLRPMLTGAVRRSKSVPVRSSFRQ